MFRNNKDEAEFILTACVSLVNVVSDTSATEFRNEIFFFFFTYKVLVLLYSYEVS